MELLLTDEQRMLQDSAARMLAGAGGVKRMRELRGMGAGFDRAMHQRMGAEGWFGILVPAEQGGLGLGLTELALVLMEAGRVLAPEPIGITTVVAGVLAKCRDLALQGELLEPLTSGQFIVAPGFSDWRTGAKLGSMDLIKDEDGSVVVEGSIDQVAHAPHADGYLLEATLVREIGLYFLPKYSSGFSIEPRASIDGRFDGRVQLDGVRARPVAIEDAAERAYDLLLFAAAAELVGVMAAALDITVEYIKTRRQFGKAIGSFQALQHRAVDDFARVASARSFVFQVARQVDVPTSQMASALKAYCSGEALKVTKSAIQMHGGIGFTDDCDIGLYLKRAMWLSAWLGNEAHHRARYA